jgi:hypothetical protein
MKPEEDDKFIAEFLGASGMYAGLIRGIVTTCIFKFQKSIALEYNAKLGELQNSYEKMFNENSMKMVQMKSELDILTAKLINKTSELDTYISKQYIT